MHILSQHMRAVKEVRKIRQQEVHRLNQLTPRAPYSARPVVRLLQEAEVSSSGEGNNSSNRDRVDTCYRAMLTYC